MDMENDDVIPCAKCAAWNQKTKSFSCSPNECAKLSNWLLKHVKEDTISMPNVVSYIV